MSSLDRPHQSSDSLHRNIFYAEASSYRRGWLFAPMSQARDPKTFYASKLDAIQGEITKKEAESQEISAKWEDASYALNLKQSYLGITDMEKLSQVVAELEEGAAYNNEEIDWRESPK